MTNKKKILQLLEENYSNTGTALRYNTPYQLLVAVILSAQTTDERVNMVTEELFQDHGSPETLINLNQSELEEKIKSIGLFHNKSKNLLAMSKMLLEKYQGQVPDTLDALIELPGVGRKTANVILANIFNKPAIAVDTHVYRVANRLGLANAPTPEKTEIQLMQKIPKKNWSKAHHWLIWHGRKICDARKPKCMECFLHDLCSFYK